MTTDERNYWDSVGADWQRSRPHRLWRECTDRHQIGLLTRWASGRIGEGRRPNLLKTDLFDNPANPLIWLRNGPLLGLLRGIGIVPYQVGATLGPRALEETARAAGFEVVETTAVMHCPRVIAVAMAGPVGRLRRAWQEMFLRKCEAWEGLEQWPTRWLTGHYVAIHAIKPKA